MRKVSVGAEEEMEIGWLYKRAPCKTVACQKELLNFVGAEEEVETGLFYKGRPL